MSKTHSRVKRGRANPSTRKLKTTSKGMRVWIWKSHLDLVYMSAVDPFKAKGSDVVFVDKLLCAALNLRSITHKPALYFISHAMRVEEKP